jgi:hypothetical protein
MSSNTLEFPRPVSSPPRSHRQRTLTFVRAFTSGTVGGFPIDVGTFADAAATGVAGTSASGVGADVGALSSVGRPRRLEALGCSRLEVVVGKDIVLGSAVLPLMGRPAVTECFI